jgi:hypothetical protein
MGDWCSVFVGDEDMEIWVYIECRGEFCWLLVAEAGMTLQMTYYSV